MMRVEKVVVGIDFSRPGIDAARWVMQHFAPKAEVILAHVIDTPRIPSFAPGSSTRRREVDPSALGETEARLRETAKTLDAGNVRTVVRTGSPHVELATFAAETGADVVAVGPHGDRPRPWKMLGTTAERLVRSAAPAALVVANPGGTPRRILVAVDDAPSTLTVLSWAKGLADALGADVTALHVLEHGATSHTPFVTVAGESSASPVAPGNDLHHEASRWLAALADTSLGHGRARTLVATGNAGDAILEMANSEKADLIVIGRRGSGTRIPAVTGSTVSTVLHGAPCPVLVVTEEPDVWTDSSVEE